MTEFVIAAHAGIGHEGGAAGQDAGIGGRHMGMGPDDQARLAVEMIGEGLLLAGRLGMDVDQDGIRRLAEAVLRQTLDGDGEGIVEGIHEQAAHDIHHHDALAVARLEQPDAAAGRAGGKILRAQQSGMAVDELGRVLLVPDMIAGRDDIDAGAVELAGRSPR